MAEKIECVGDVYGELTVVGEAETYYNPSGRAIRMVLCECSCGNRKEFQLQNLRIGNTKTCGCGPVGGRKHGHRRMNDGKSSATYNTWTAMRARCHDPKNGAYERYGAKGVTVCKRWRDSFENFLEDMGERPAGRTLDRIKGHLGYEKSNCRWATATEQYENKRVVRDASGRFT